MDITDEILTPGCPNCVVKHLSAALAYLADNPDRRSPCPLDAATEVGTLAARAYVNLVEAMTGYASHVYLAIGLLERAESSAARACAGEKLAALRTVRTDLIGRDAKAVPDALAALSGVCAKADFVLAHLHEACREAPADVMVRTGPCGADAGAILEVLRQVRENYFAAPMSGAAEETTKQEGA